MSDAELDNPTITAFGSIAVLIQKDVLPSS